MSSSDGHTRSGSSSTDPFSNPDVYYGKDDNIKKFKSRRRAFSVGLNDYSREDVNQFFGTLPSRRGSHDEASGQPRKFLIEVEETLATLLKQEDTDQNMQITIEDLGPKVCLMEHGAKHPGRLLIVVGHLGRDCGIIRT